MVMLKTTKKKEVTKLLGDSSLKYADISTRFNLNAFQDPLKHIMSIWATGLLWVSVVSVPKPKGLKWCHDNFSDLTKLLKRPQETHTQCFHRLCSHRSSLAANWFWHLKSAGFPVNSSEWGLTVLNDSTYYLVIKIKNVPWVVVFFF